MANRTLVTFGTDGLRDWVTLPDGRTFNMGSVSVLKFVVELARTPREARKALDLFLEKQQATLAVPMGDLQILLSPKRARWAGLEETLITSDSHTSPGEGALMSQDNMLFQNRLASVADALHHLEAGEASADVVAPQIQATIRELLAMVSPAPVAAPSVVEVDTSTHFELGFRTAAYDEDMARELEVYLDNEMSLQGQRRTVLKKLLKDGEYDVKEAEKAFEDWVEAGAKAYSREFDEDPKKFSKELVKDLAEKMAKSHKKAVDAGEYDHLKSATAEDNQFVFVTEGKEPWQNQALLVNEGLAHAVLAKVQTAYEAVTASKSKFASMAREDLSRISSGLSDLVNDSDLSAPGASSVLLDLSKRADHVLNHFVR